MGHIAVPATETCAEVHATVTSAREVRYTSRKFVREGGFMLPTYQSLRDQLMTVIDNKQEQGHIVIGLAETLASLPESYDALATFAASLADLPKEVDWPFDEPNALDAIWDGCDPERPLGAI